MQKRILKGYNATATASATTNGSFTNVNDQKAVGVLPIVKDVTNVTGCLISVWVNGAILIDSMDIIEFGSLSKRLNAFYTDIEENAQISYELENSVASNIDIDFVLMYQKPYKDCERKALTKEKMLNETTVITATAGATTTSNQTINVGRGSVSSLFVSKENATYDEAYEDTLNVYAQSKAVIENVTLAIAFSGYCGISNLKMPIMIPEGATVKTEITNAGGANKQYFLNLGYNGN